MVDRDLCNVGAKPALAVSVKLVLAVMMLGPLGASADFERVPLAYEVATRRSSLQLEYLELVVTTDRLSFEGPINQSEWFLTEHSDRLELKRRYDDNRSIQLFHLREIPPLTEEELERRNAELKAELKRRLEAATDTEDPAPFEAPDPLLRQTQALEELTPRQRYKLMTNQLRRAAWALTITGVVNFGTDAIFNDDIRFVRNRRFRTPGYEWRSLARALKRKAEPGTMPDLTPSRIVWFVPLEGQPREPLEYFVIDMRVPLNADGRPEWGPTDAFLGTFDISLSKEDESEEDGTESGE